MIVAITGGTGFLGSHLARTLVANGHYAKLLARGLNKRDEGIRKVPNASFTPLHLNDDKKLFQALSGCDAVAHLVGINRETQKGDFYKVHVDSTIHVLNMARKAGIKKIVMVSYLRARPSAFSAYFKSKWDAEELIRASELDYTILKPGIIYGSGDQMLTQIKHTLDMIPGIAVFPAVGLLEKTLRPIAVEDMVKILMAALLENRMSRQTLAVIGPEELTLTQCVYRVGKVMNKPTIVVPLLAAAHYMLSSSMEKSMKEPLIAFAQVRMLAEGMSKPLPNAELVPSDLEPQTKFTDEQIRAGLSEPDAN